LIKFIKKNQRKFESYSETISEDGKYVLVVKNNSFFVARTSDNKIVRRNFEVKEEEGMFRNKITEALLQVEELVRKGRTTLPKNFHMSEAEARDLLLENMGKVELFETPIEDIVILIVEEMGGEFK
jgi:hypothetical protein